MKIVPIFVPTLYAIHYDNEEEDIYSKMLNAWQDVIFIKEFYETNLAYIVENRFINAKDLKEFQQKIYNHAVDFDIRLEEANKNESLNEHFEVLYSNERIYELHSKRKAKIQFLRVYGIKIEDTFIVTGGAIKLSQTMQEHPLTKLELVKLENVKQFLIDHQITDEDSFYDYLTEQTEND